jgi:hypothetical protein
MQEAVLILFSHVFRKYVIYPIDVREVLRVPRFCSVRQYVILSTTHRLPTHCLLCYDCTQKVRYLLCLQNLIIIPVSLIVCLPDTIFSLYHVAKLTDISVSRTNNF